MHHVPNIFSCRYSVRLYCDDGWDVYDRGTLIHHDLPIEEALWLIGELEAPAEPNDIPNTDRSHLVSSVGDWQYSALRNGR